MKIRLEEAPKFLLGNSKLEQAIGPVSALREDVSVRKDVHEIYGKEKLIHGC